MSPKLTVIIPVFNGMPFLKEAVESILLQSYKDFDLLVIDDGSTDSRVMEYLNSLSDPRLKIKQQNNQGLCHSLNNAIAQVDSDFIARLDQDDVALPSRLEEQMNFLINHPTYSCVLSQILKIGAKGQEFVYYQNSIEPFEDYNLQRHGSIVHSSICFAREKFMEIGGYRQHLYPTDDLDLLIKFSENGRVAIINKPLVKYRVHSQAASFKYFREMEMKRRYILQMYEFRNSGKSDISIEEFINMFDNATLYRQFKKELNETGQLFIQKARMYLFNDKIIQGLISLLIAFLLDPSFVFKKLLVLRKIRRS
jgi:glycosyltransferase involved in cell wall biosynthesis